MEKKAFTLIELLAVIIILSVIAVIVTPNITKLMNDSKKSKYIADAKIIVSRANYMSKLEKYNLRFEEDGKIFLKDLDHNNIDTDPFGYDYDTNDSYVQIQTSVNSDNLPVKTLKVYLKSCSKKDSNICNCLGTSDNPIDSEKIKTSDVNIC